jgi:hypothetical protein
MIGIRRNQTLRAPALYTTSESAAVMGFSSLSDRHLAVVMVEVD